MRLGLSDRQALLLILFAAFMLSSIGMLGEYLQVPEYIMFALFLAFFAIYNYALMHVWVLQKRVKRLFTNSTQNTA